MCSTTWESLSSAYVCPWVYTEDVCWFAICASEGALSSPLSALNMLQSFGLLRPVTTLIASHSRCHPSSSGWLRAIGERSISRLSSSPLSLIWSSKLHPGTRHEAWSIGHAWREAFPVPLPSSWCLQIDSKQTNALWKLPPPPFSGVPCVPVPVSTFCSLLYLPHICFFGSFLNDEPRINKVYSIILKLFFSRDFFLCWNNFQKVNKSWSNRNTALKKSMSRPKKRGK